MDLIDAASEQQLKDQFIDLWHRRKGNFQNMGRGRTLYSVGEPKEMTLAVNMELRGNFLEQMQNASILMAVFFDDLIRNLEETNVHFRVFDDSIEIGEHLVHERPDPDHIISVDIRFIAAWGHPTRNEVFGPGSKARVSPYIARILISGGYAEVDK